MLDNFLRCDPAQCPVKDVTELLELFLEKIFMGSGSVYLKINVIDYRLHSKEFLEQELHVLCLSRILYFI